MKKHLIRLATVGTLSIISFTPALAQQNQNQGSTNNGNNPNNYTESNLGTGNQTQNGQDNSENQGQGLSDSRKQTCNNRKGNIDKIMNQYSVNIQNNLSLFNKITDRVRTYYEQKQLNLSNYDQLMAEINTRQQAATQSKDRIHQNTSINCSSSDPIGATQQFRTNAQTAQQNLEAYRLSIHNLITEILNSTGN